MRARPLLFSCLLAWLGPWTDLLCNSTVISCSLPCRLSHMRADPTMLLAWTLALGLALASQADSQQLSNWNTGVATFYVSNGHESDRCTS